MLRERARTLSWIARVSEAGAAAVCVLVFLPFVRPAVDASPPSTGLPVLAAISCLVWPVVWHFFRLYESLRRVGLVGTFARVATANLVSVAVLLVAGGMLSTSPSSTHFALAVGASVTGAQLVGRLLVLSVLQMIRRRGLNYRTVLIVGAGARALAATRWVESHPQWGIRVVGYLDDCADGFEPLVSRARIFRTKEIATCLTDQVIDEVLVACPLRLLGELGPVVESTARVGVPLTFLTDFFDGPMVQPRSGTLGGRTTVSFAPVHHDRRKLAIKRTMDVVLGVPLLVLALPVLALSALAIKLTSRGPVLFRQTRCGLNGRRFQMLKLRSMRQDAEAEKSFLRGRSDVGGPVFKMKEDPRITSVGRFLRRWSIDELPQLWNVVRGEMSLVGPRPPTPDEVAQYVADERRRLSVRPGITCLWQVGGRSTLPFDRWMKLDLEYIDRWTLFLDLWIMARTLPEVVRGRGAY